MSALHPALGWINHSLLADNRPDPWAFLAAAERLREVVGSDATRAIVAHDPDASWEIQTCTWIYDMCRIAFAYEGGPVDLAARIRAFALDYTLAEADPVNLSLFALCAFVAESGRSTLPGRERTAAILAWYLDDFLVRHPGELSPAQVKRLLAERETGALRWQATDSIQALPALAPGKPRSRASAAHPLRSGDHVWFRAGGSGERHLLPGDWNELESEHCWSKPFSGIVTFELRDPVGARCLLELDLTVADWPAPKLPRCIVTLNGRELQAIAKPGRYRLRLLLPGSALHHGHNDLGLHAPTFAPRLYGSADHRDLGTALSRMRICLDV